MDNKDVLSDVFSTLRISSNFYFQAELRGEFAIELPPEQRHIRFHLVRQGECWLRMPGGDLTRLTEGDVAVVPNGTGQILASSPQVEPEKLAQIIEGGALKGGVLYYGSGRPQAKLLCGFFQFDEAIDHPVLTNLPEIIVVRPADLGAEPWTMATLRLLSLEVELGGQGMNGILARLLEVLFIQTVRRVSVGLDYKTNGFIAALSDSQLSRALQAIHNQPETPWKISDLAKISGMSRARFADKFVEVVGVPPIGYLTTWRLMKARLLLINSDLDIGEISIRCGYASVPSFSSRFKKSFNIGPGAFRRSYRQSGPQS